MRSSKDLEPRGALLGVDLHVHEMIFGFAAAVIAGFLLTAVKNWTGRAPAPPRLLGVLVALFVLGRVAVAAEAAGAPRGIAAVELPRFRGHPNICVSGVHNVEEECSVFP